MKTLYIFRHGDTEDPGSDTDYNRKLTLEGKLRSSAMASHLKEDRPQIERLITSGAVRAKATAGIIAGTLAYPESNIEIDDLLYSSQHPDDIIPLIWNSSPDISAIMIVGHNPLLSDLVSYISRFSGEISMDKSSVVRIDFDTDDWGSIAQRSGKIIFYKIFKGDSIINAFD